MKAIDFETFKRKAILVHGSRYFYYYEGYSKISSKTRIGCSKHGDFLQNADSHIRGNGCPQCAKDIAGTQSKKSFSDFLAKARAVHAYEYEYDEETYTLRGKKTKIVCKEHGYFFQTPSNHLKGQRCPKCSDGSVTFTTFVERAREVHGDKYVYTKEGYQQLSKKAKILCPTHGEFYQSAQGHVLGKGCVHCRRKLYSEEGYLKEAMEVHSGRYTYGGVDLKKGKVTVVCGVHGAFSQGIYRHIKGTGCKKCADSLNGDRARMKFTEFEMSANTVHEGRYKYLEDTFYSYKGTVEIICAKHGNFHLLVGNHLSGRGCPRCTSGGPSTFEQQLADAFKYLNPKLNYRIPLYGETVRKGDGELTFWTEVDLYIPTANLAIEADGLYWHREDAVGRHYHSDKTKALNAWGIDLIHIFEDEWLEKRGIVESLIKARLGEYNSRIPARKTELREISKADAKKFYEDNHIQGGIGCPINYGLLKEGVLVAAASYAYRERLYKSKDLELVRFCTLLNTQVFGGLSKLLRPVRHLKVRSYCDNRLFNGKGYLAVGFKKVSESLPGYYYTRSKYRYSRYGYQKHLLKDKLTVFDSELSEYENMKANGFDRIYDCGMSVYELDPI